MRRILLSALLVLPFGATAVAQSSPPFEAERWESLSWREVGPDRGGRSCAVAGIPGDPRTFYMGACGGGVWQTQDAGARWTNISDGSFGGSIGALAVSEWDPNVIWVGTGEKTLRGNVSHGDGVWRSTDAGKTWSHAGLGDSRHVTRIRVHPRDADTAWAACLGHLHGPNEERGVFKTTDGGQTWRRVLFVSAEAGAVDLCLDPTNPRVLFATTWKVQRTPYSLDSGGEGSGLWKSTDGGETWTELTDNPGLPKGPLGIGGVCVSPSNPQNVYAILEAPEGGVFRSRDGGATWRKVNSERSLRQRAWYYTRIYADPADEDAVYVLNVRFWRSVNGGKDFEGISVPHGDNHDLWIDPGRPDRMIQANDGGANVSYDGGETWSRQDNQPTAQMYRVSTDNAFPYRLLGGQQDNSTVRIRSRSFTGGGIGERLSEWSSTAGGESGHVVAHPDDPDIVYGGSYGGLPDARQPHDGRAAQRARLAGQPDGRGRGGPEVPLPVELPDLLLPARPAPALLQPRRSCSVRDDEGASWEAISPDLTRNDKSMQRSSGGPITQDNTSVEYYATIFAALESPHEAGVLWSGSDDGLVHVTRNGGATWRDVTPPGLPEWSMVNSIEAHPTEPGGLYFAATRYKLDDFEPYLYATLDYGQSWRRIDAGIDREHFTRVVRADPERPGLLYAGTERGVHASFDDGAAWTPLQLDLPVAPVTDLAVKNGDLIAATQGRGFWILDNVSPLHSWTGLGEGFGFAMLPPRPGMRARGYEPQLDWYLSEAPAKGTERELVILEPNGAIARTWKGSQVPAKAGLNRFRWDLSYERAKGFDGMILWTGGLMGARAVPGTYTARLTIDGLSAELPFEVLADPRSSATQEDLQAQHDFLRETGTVLTEAHDAITAIRGVRGALKDVRGRLADEESSDALRTRIDAALKSMTEVEEALYQTKNESRQDPLNFPIRLTDKYAGVRSSVSTGDWAPTRQAQQVRVELEAAIRTQLDAWNALQAQELPGIDAALREAGTPHLPSAETPAGADDATLTTAR